MKHHLSGRKHLLAFALAAAFALCTAVPVLAATGSQYLEQLSEYTEIKVYATHDEATYKVELSWGSMEFLYRYGTGWDYSQAGDFNQIKIVNFSNVPVAAKLDFTGETKYDSSTGKYVTFNGKFNSEKDGTGENYRMLYLDEGVSADPPEGNIYLTLEGALPPESSSPLVGEITITLVDGVTSGMDTLAIECGGEENIGYVTSASELKPFTEKD